LTSPEAPCSSDAARASVQMLEHRVALLPDHLRRVLAARASIPRLPERGALAITGVGASEGPARYLSELLHHFHGRHAPFVPLSCFATADREPDGEMLVVFSQGLSANARMALATRGQHRSALLVTALEPERASGTAASLLASIRRDGATVVTHPPEDESGTLLRVVGPAVASFVAALLASTLESREARYRGFDGSGYDGIERVPDLVASAAERVAGAVGDLDPEWLLGRVAFVTAGALGDGYHAPRWKWLEGLLSPEPSCWDVLQVAHGAFQQFYGERMLLVALEHATVERERLLFDRLQGMLVPERHAMIRLKSGLPRHLALLDHDAQVSQLLLRALRYRPRDLATWPGMGLDGPLYGLDGPP